MVGPLEEQRNFLVKDPVHSGRNITDIDSIQGQILWEEKTAVHAINQKTGVDETPRWIQENITKKLARILEARQHLPPYYAQAAIGFHFTTAGVDPGFKAAIEQAIETLRHLYPEVTLLVKWE